MPKHKNDAQNGETGTHHAKKDSKISQGFQAVATKLAKRSRKVGITEETPDKAEIDTQEPQPDDGLNDFEATPKATLAQTLGLLRDSIVIQVNKIALKVVGDSEANKPETNRLTKALQESVKKLTGKVDEAIAHIKAKGPDTTKLTAALDSLTIKIIAVGKKVDKMIIDTSDTMTRAALNKVSTAFKSLREKIHLIPKPQVFFSHGSKKQVKPEGQEEPKPSGRRRIAPE
jgi:hypothetical protein